MERKESRSGLTLRQLCNFTHGDVYGYSLCLQHRMDLVLSLHLQSCCCPQPMLHHLPPEKKSAALVLKVCETVDLMLVCHLLDKHHVNNIMIAETVNVRWLGVKLNGVTRSWKTKSCPPRSLRHCGSSTLPPPFICSCWKVGDYIQLL